MSTVHSNIYFHYLSDPFFFPNRNKLKNFLAALAKTEKQSIDTINYIFCTDEYLLKVNQDHLNHDTYTDIITFQLSPKGEPLLSDIYISIDRVKENAVQHSNTFTIELHRVIFHGLLHLCGYKDKFPADIKAMRKAEDVALETYFVSRGTQH
jgi:probable rRNA maturation factor